jgi:hypothetical protein
MVWVQEGKNNNKEKKFGADGKLFRIIFILFDDQQFGNLPPWQIAVF